MATADGCLICSGPLHDTWLGTGALIAGYLLVAAVVALCIAVSEERDRRHRPPSDYADDSMVMLGLVWPLGAAAVVAWSIYCVGRAFVEMYVDRRPGRPPVEVLRERIAALEDELADELASPASTGGESL